MRSNSGITDGNEGLDSKGEAGAQVLDAARSTLRVVRAIAGGVSEVSTLSNLLPESGSPRPDSRRSQGELVVRVYTENGIGVV